MAIGRASGEKRVQKAILNALDSPLLYGSDISKAKNILFNIYASNKAPLFVKELQEIDAFMYELDPNINVIWGTSDDDTLDQDAKVVILATGLDNEFLPKDEMQENKNDSYYDQVISKLYRENDYRGVQKRMQQKEAKDDEDSLNHDVTFTVKLGGDETGSKMPTEDVRDVETPEKTPAVEDKQWGNNAKSTDTKSTDTKSSDRNDSHDAGGKRHSLSFAERVRQRIARSLQEITNNMAQDE